MIVKEWHMDNIINGRENWNLYLMAGVEGPMGDDWHWYPIQYEPKRITESVSDSKSISKMEELYALELIRKNILPSIVKRTHERTPDNLFYGDPIIDVDSFKRSLKKVRRNNDFGDYIVYQAKHPETKEPFEFKIFKNVSGTLFVRRYDDGTSVIVKP